MKPKMKTSFPWICLWVALLHYATVIAIYAPLEDWWHFIGVFFFVKALDKFIKHRLKYNNEETDDW